jgi:hypothetical protein
MDRGQVRNTRLQRLSDFVKMTRVWLNFAKLEGPLNNITCKTRCFQDHCLAVVFLKNILNINISK